jgi:hypothetical protein|tara:strand:- start:1075 stop:1209 length:135 start_codon:yes stop_codon:yes gene_type:complete
MGSPVIQRHIALNIFTDTKKGQIAPFIEVNFEYWFTSSKANVLL